MKRHHFNLIVDAKNPHPNLTVTDPQLSNRLDQLFAENDILSLLEKLNRDYELTLVETFDQEKEDAALNKIAWEILEAEPDETLVDQAIFGIEKTRAERKPKK